MSNFSLIENRRKTEPMSRGFRAPVVGLGIAGALTPAAWIEIAGSSGWSFTEVPLVAALVWTAIDCLEDALEGDRYSAQTSAEATPSPLWSLTADNCR